MKGDSQVIKVLNQVLKNELTSINQYFLHAKIVKNQGLEKLAATIHKESIDEMKHADQLMERILFLEGNPQMQALNELRIGTDTESILQNDLALEIEAIDYLRKEISAVRDTNDHITVDLLESILASEETHIEFLETQLELIKQLGIENYRQTQV